MEWKKYRKSDEAITYLNELAKNSGGSYHPENGIIENDNGYEIPTEIVPAYTKIIANIAWRIMPEIKRYVVLVKDPLKGYQGVNSEGKLEAITTEELNKIKSVGKK